MSRFYIRLCESHTINIKLYYTVFPVPHVEEVNKIIVMVIVIGYVESVYSQDSVTSQNGIEKHRLGCRYNVLIRRCDHTHIEHHSYVVKRGGLDLTKGRSNMTSMGGLKQTKM